MSQYIRRKEKNKCHLIKMCVGTTKIGTIKNLNLQPLKRCLLIHRNRKNK